MNATVQSMVQYRAYNLILYYRQIAIYVIAIDALFYDDRAA